VRELVASKFPIAMYEAGLADGTPAWGHGGFLLLDDLAAGVTYRASRRPDLVSESVLVRVLAPVGGWFSADLLDRMADAADQHGEGLIHLTTGGTIEIYVPRENVMPLVAALNDCGLDVGSTGDDLRGVTACCGPARCDCAIVDATGLATAIGRQFMDEQQYPGFPHKCKTAVAGCANDCIRAVMQKDHTFVGVYRDLPRLDQERLREWIAGGGEMDALMAACPGAAIRFDGQEAVIDGDRCARCMVCINRSPAFRPGRERGVAWVVGGKYGCRGPAGPMVGTVLIPFIPVVDGDYSQVADVFARFLEVWSEHGGIKERVGDFIVRYGTDNILREMGLDPEGGC
jgi:sulfite reductase alpha subunit